MVSPVDANGKKRKGGGMPAKEGSTPQVLFGLFGFAEQIGHVLASGFDEPLELTHLIFELGGELALLLIPPGLFELVHLSAQRAGTLL